MSESSLEILKLLKIVGHILLKRLRQKPLHANCKCQGTDDSTMLIRLLQREYPLEPVERRLNCVISFGRLIPSVSQRKIQSSVRLRRPGLSGFYFAVQIDHSPPLQFCYKNSSTEHIGYIKSNNTCSLGSTPCHNLFLSCTQWGKKEKHFQ